MLTLESQAFGSSGQKPLNFLTWRRELMVHKTGAKHLADESQLLL